VLDLYFRCLYSLQGIMSCSIVLVGWRDVLKRCAPVWMFWVPWSSNESSLVTQCPGIDTSLSLCITYAICFDWCNMPGMYQCKDILIPGRFIWGTRGPRTLIWGHIVSGRHVTPTLFYIALGVSGCNASGVALLVLYLGVLGTHCCITLSASPITIQIQYCVALRCLLMCF